MQKNLLKNEKGSIILYVLITMLFLLVVLMSIYISGKNHNAAQLKELEKIEKQYNDAIDMESAYNEVINSKYIDVGFEPNGGTYQIAEGGKVQISSKITIGEDTEQNSPKRLYGWSESETNQPSKWKEFDANEITVNTECNAGEYYLWVKTLTANGQMGKQISNVFSIHENTAHITKSTEEMTRENITITITYDEGLTKNKKIGFGATQEEAKNNQSEQTAEEIVATSHGYVYITAEDEYGNIFEKYEEISNIDKEEPIITLTPNGNKYLVEENGTTQINVGVSVEDKISGVNEVKYYWSTSNIEKPTDSEYTTVENNSNILSEPLGEGTYYLWIKTTDNVGNVKEEPSYAYVVKEPLPPEISLKENDATGNIYTSGTWTNQDIYTEITIPEEEGTVEKYEYSTDLVNWYDVSEISAVTSINYTTTFPYQEGKPDWLGEITPNGSYYFDIDETTGALTSAGEHGNKGIQSKTANSYIPIDLSKYSEEDKLMVSLNYTVYSENGCDIGYATITETTTAPADNASTTDRFVYASGNKKTETKNKELLGGKIYYLHLGYRKDFSVNTGDDSFVINSLTLTSESLGTGLNFNEYQKQDNKVTFKLSQEINTDVYFRASYEDSGKSKISDKVTVKIDKTSPTADINYDFTSLDRAEITISNIVDKGSGLRGYYISEEETEPTLESSWIETTEKTIVLSNQAVNTTYYIWLIDNANNISNKITNQVTEANYRIDSNKYAPTLEKAIAKAEDSSTITLLKDFEDSSVATINKNITLDVQSYTLTRTQTITVNSDNTVEIVGEGTITSSTNNHTISNSGTLTINMTGKIENTASSSSYSAVYNTKNLTITQGTVSGKYRGIYTNSSSATLDIDGGNVLATEETSSAYAIYGYGAMNINGGIIQGYTGIDRSSSSGDTIINSGTIKGTGSNGLYGSGNTTINGGQIEGKTNGVYQNSGTLNVLGGTIKGDKGIYQYSSAIINVYGGKIEGKTYGIHGYSTDKITIGNIDEEVDNISPSIYGESYGIYMNTETYGFKFNKGIIMSDTETTTYRGVLNPRESYITYTYYSYLEKKWCTALTPSVSEITFSHEPQGFTNQNVKVKVQYPSSIMKQFSEDGENWIDVLQNVYETNISENKTVYARTLDESGILTEEKQYEINTIDKISPEVEVATEKTKYTITDHSDKVDIQYSITATDEGVSGLKETKYAWVKEGNNVDTYTDIQNGKTIIQSSLLEGNYYLYLKVTDNAGNESEINQMRFNVVYQEPVAQIGETTYATIQEAIEASSKEAGETTTTIKILKSTDEESTIYEGQNIILDLQGHTVGSSNANQATFTNNGTLTIIDTSDTKTGTIENLIGTAIENNGTLTLGDNTTAIEDETPTISGKKVGIKNNNTLNYYDGTIKGKVAINGNVQGTPEEYGPVGIYENGITIVNLRVVSGYVARIEWFYYTTLQSAFDDCESRINNTEKTTVVMLKDIVLQDTAKIYNGQNICLDLNGYSLTNTNNTILSNTGILEIADLTQETNGKIISSIEGSWDLRYGYKLINNNGYLSLASGNIITEYDYNYLIFNEKGTVDINGGMIENNRKSSSGSWGHNYGIYNNGEGTVNVNRGIVNIGDIDTYSYSYGIYNNGAGTINVNGGTVSSSSRDISYGIYNGGAGTINVNDGTVSSSTSNSSDSACGIYNYDTGTINVNGGEVSSSSSSSNSRLHVYGILNVRAGTVNVNGGEVSSSSNKVAYGIRNSETGTININGGIVKSSSNGNDTYGIYNASTGIININGGTVSTVTDCSGWIYGIYNESIGTINVNEGEVMTTKSSTGVVNGIYNKDNGTVNINGGIVRSNSNTNISGGGMDSVYGICNILNGTINIKGGTISSNINENGSNSMTVQVYGIRNSGKGKIVLGTKGDESVNNMIPSIIANYTGTGLYNACGVCNERGNIYFYDGIIKETTKYGSYGITEIENGYQIKEEYIDGYSNIYLEPNAEEYIVINNDTKKQYTNLQEAIDESIDNEQAHLQLLKDFELKTQVEVSEAKNIMLDLAGKIITNRYIIIRNKGILTIEDSIGEGEILNVENNCGIVNEMKFIINGGTVRNDSSNSSYVYGIYNISEGTIDINGGKIDCISNAETSYVYGISNTENGIVNLNGGEIDCSSNANYTYVYGIINRENGIVNVDGGKISCRYSGKNNNRTIYGISNTGNGTINVNEGEISCSSNEGECIGIYNSSTGTINVNGGTVSSSGKSYGSYGIYNYSGIISVRGGTITSSSNSYAYGIFNYQNGTITIGTKGDGIISTTNPSITATYTGTSSSYGGYGIQNTNGTLYFYDGRIEGSTLALYTNSLITEWEENAELNYQDEDKVLTLTTEAMDIAKIGDTTYTSLEEAILAAGTNETTIELLRGIQYSNAATTIQIAGDQNITIDLKGYSINSALEDSVFVNKGKLKIIDSTDEPKGKIISGFEKIINNEGTLELSNVTISEIKSVGYPVYNTIGATMNLTNGQLLGGEKSLYNLGNVNINGTTIKKEIVNTGNANLKIEAGTIEAQIINQENARLEITGGELKDNISSTPIDAIKNESANEVSITGGTVYGIYSTGGTINIGTKDINIIEEPVIIGLSNKIYGIYSNCELNFYDGIIKGKEKAIDGNISDIEDRAELVTGEEEIDGVTFKTLTISKVETATASVNETEYDSLKEAIDAISETGTVTILRTGTISESIEISTDKTITIDLNGNTITTYNQIQNNGTLKITDTSSESTGTLKGHKEGPINNSGNLEIISGNISGNIYGIYNNQNGTSTITGGTISDNNYGVYNINGGAVNVAGGNITQNTYGVYNYSGTTSVTGGSITQNTYGVYNYSGTTSVTGGSITQNTYGIYNSEGTTNVSGATINANENGIYNSTGTINITEITITGNTKEVVNGGKGTINIGTQDGLVNKESPIIQGEEYGINNSGSGTIAFYDGIIKGKVGAISGYYLYTETGYTVKTEVVDGYNCDTLALSGTVSTVAKIGNMEYTNLQSAINACTTEEATTITLVNGINTNATFIIEEGQNIIIDLNGKTITSNTVENTIQNAGNLTIIDSNTNQTGKVTNTYGNTINNSGTLTLGQNDETVSTTCPEVSSVTTAIVNTGTLNFYDGIISGSTAVDGVVTNRANGYIIKSQTVDGKQQLYLSK